MTAKIASAALCLVFGLQAIFAQSTCGCGNNGLAYNGLGYNGLGYNGLSNKGLGYNGLSNNGLSYNGLGCNGLGYNGLSNNGLSGLNVAANAGSYAGYGVGTTGVASTGGGLIVSSVSPIAPLGISVLSDVSYEGQITANGNLPFLGTVNVAGLLGTAGVGAVTYGCGSGDLGISAEGPITTGIVVPGAIYPPSISPSASALADALAIVPSLGSYALIGNQAIGSNYASGSYGSGAINGGVGYGCI